MSVLELFRTDCIKLNNPKTPLYILVADLIIAPAYTIVGFIIVYSIDTTYILLTRTRVYQSKKKRINVD